LHHGYRRYRYQSHHIFYTQESDHVLIRAILHTAQDLRPDLFD
jgi:toxin ParE1/3/4